jgi:GTP-binding protein HflX
VEDKLFATLDPATRRLKGATRQDWIVTDTVGLIKDLPRDLMVAFRPTFDELQESTLLIHLADVSSPSVGEQIEAVEKILSDLDLGHLPRLLVLNKEDKLAPDEVKALCRKYQAIAISSLWPESLSRLFRAIEERLWKEERTGPFFQLEKLTHSTALSPAFQDEEDGAAQGQPRANPGIYAGESKG